MVVWAVSMAGGAVALDIVVEVERNGVSVVGVRF
jgi:hypothetical protein